MYFQEQPAVRIRRTVEVEFFPGPGPRPLGVLCPLDCICGGSLTRDECDRRLGLLWGALVGRLDVESLIRRAESYPGWDGRQAASRRRDRLSANPLLIQAATEGSTEPHGTDR